MEPTLSSSEPRRGGAHLGAKRASWPRLRELRLDAAPCGEQLCAGRLVASPNREGAERAAERQDEEADPGQEERDPHDDGEDGNLLGEERGVQRGRERRLRDP